MIILSFLHGLLFAYAAFSVVYLLVFALAGRRRLAPMDASTNPGSRRFAVLIPAYREDAVIVDTARKALAQRYRKDRYEVVVIADSLQGPTLDLLGSLPIRVIPVSFEKSTKALALNAAMGRLPADAFDAVVVLDADNVMADDFLACVDAALASGAAVVQGRRVAKNADTPLAVLDAASESINNHIFRLGHRALGLSSALIGSGMAFDYGLFRRVMADIAAVGGFDKELELKLMRDGVRLEYAEAAVVFDEKVSHADVFVNQRTRWLAAQGHYLKLFLGPAVIHLVRRGNVDFFNKALQMALPPRVLLLGALPLATLLAAPTAGFAWALAWLGLTALLLLSLALALPADTRPSGLFRAALRLPAAVLLMLRALVRSRNGNRRFIHTPHSVTQVTLQPSDAP